MTPTEKQKCIAEQAVYGDLMLNRRAYDDVEEKYITEQVDSKWVLDFINYDKLLSLTPILRPLSDLTKEMTHNGCNDDKPFVPAAIINKMELGTYAINLGQDSLRPRRHIKENDLLHLWHFDTRNLIERGEAVDVNTLDINPYSVAMNQIRSKRAKSHIEKWQWQSKGGTLDNSPIILRSIAAEGIVIAETEAEQRHSEQLEALKQKAVEAHKAVCINTKCQSNTTWDNGFGNNKCGGNCEYVKQFTQKLNEK